MSTRKIAGIGFVVAVLLIMSGALYNNDAQAFIPIPLNSSEIAFGGIIRKITPCECPIPGILIEIDGDIGGAGIGGKGGFGGKVFYRPGSSVTVFGGQFLRVSPFVVGTISKTPYYCGEIDEDGGGAGILGGVGGGAAFGPIGAIAGAVAGGANALSKFCIPLDAGFQLKSIGSFL